MRAMIFCNKQKLSSLLMTSVLFPSAVLFSQTTRQQVNLYNIPNQSAHFVRMPSRESSTEIDAVYANPAGVASMKDGFHFSISNQFAWQKMTLTSDYSNLNEAPTTYSGSVRALLFPNMYAVWKKNRLAITGAILLAGGGGGATFNNLPSADMGISDVPSALKLTLLDFLNESVTSATGNNPGYNDIQGYGFNFHSYGVAYSPAFQAGGAYKFNEYISIAGAVRYVTTTTRSEGYLRNIQINVPQHGGYYNPSEYLRFLSQQDDINSGQSSLLDAVAMLYDELAADRDVDVIQKGQGFTPVVGIHSTPVKGLDIGIKYEHNTSIILRTKVYDGKDGGGQFNDGETVRSDFPGYISAGVKYQLSKKWLAAGGSRYFFSKKANYNGREMFIRHNYFETAIATEYLVAENIKLSGGYTYLHPSVDQSYQNEVDFQTPGHSVAFGGAYSINGALVCNAGMLVTRFVKKSYQYEHIFSDGVIEIDPVPYNRTHAKSAFIFSLGMDFYFN